MASGCRAWIISDRMPARGKQRSRLTRQTMLRGPKRPSSVGFSGTARSYALASGSSGFSRAVSTPPRYGDTGAKFRTSGVSGAFWGRPKRTPDASRAETARLLGQDFLSLRKVIDGLRSNLFEASRQALAQDPGARGSGVQAWDEHEVGPLLVEVQSLRNVLGGQDHARIRGVHVRDMHQPQVARAPEHVVGDARHDELGVLNPGVAQRV